MIVDKNGKRNAEIEATKNAFLIGETLYDKYDKSFMAVDLREIIKNE